jgi:hypothetical protein
MVCVECKASNPDENVYCGRCGAELGVPIAETILKRGIRDRKAVEYELTESVADRLKKWGGLLATIFALVLGYGYLDFTRGVNAAKSEIARSVQDAKTNIEALRKSADALAPQIADIQGNIDSYRQTNVKIAKLQKDLTDVSQQVVDIGKRDFKANSIQTTGPGPSHIQFGALGCPASVDNGMLVDYCTESSPETLYQLTASGELRAVASRSPSGFQDGSTAAKPACDAAARGTIYVEKGGKGKSDEPFLCGKKSNEQYDWAPLGAANQR